MEGSSFVEILEVNLGEVKETHCTVKEAFIVATVHYYIYMYGVCGSAFLWLLHLFALDVRTGVSVTYYRYDCI